MASNAATEKWLKELDETFKKHEIQMELTHTLREAGCGTGEAPGELREIDYISH